MHCNNPCLASIVPIFTNKNCLTKEMNQSSPWWRHQMETFSALLALYAGNSPVPGEFSTQRSVTLSFDVYFDLRPNRRLSKQSWGWWFETASCPLWRHRNDIHSFCEGCEIIHSMHSTAFSLNCPWSYSISQEICTRFCCALLCCGYAIVHNEFTWSIYPYSSGLLCWHWGNR